MINDPKTQQGPFGEIFLGKTGLRVSRLCLGTMTFGAQMDTRSSHALLDYALDRGCFFIDTANAYSAGRSEEILGEWLKIHRNRVVVSSKVRYQVGDDPMSVGLSRRTIKTEVENSLRRLKTDFLDILYLHQPDDNTNIEETLRAVDDLVRDGKVHILGVSNFAAWQIVKTHWAADRCNLTPPRVVQPMYNLIARGIEQELLPCCRELQIPAFVYNPLAAGLLTGKHRMKTGIIDGRFTVFPYYQDRYWNQRAFEAVEALQGIADEHGCSLIGLSFQWLMDRPDVAGIILGASSMEQMKENFDAFGEPLPESANAAIDAVWHDLKGPAPAYNR